MKMYYVKTYKRADGGFDIEPAIYGGKDISVGGNTYLVHTEGSRSVVEVPDTEHRHLLHHGFIAAPAMTEMMVDAAAAQAQADNAREAIARGSTVVLDAKGKPIDPRTVGRDTGVVQAPGPINPGVDTSKMDADYERLHRHDGESDILRDSAGTIDKPKATSADRMDAVKRAVDTFDHEKEREEGLHKPLPAIDEHNMPDPIDPKVLDASKNDPTRRDADAHEANWTDAQKRLARDAQAEKDAGGHLDTTAKDAAARASAAQEDLDKEKARSEQPGAPATKGINDVDKGKPDDKVDSDKKDKDNGKSKK